MTNTSLNTVLPISIIAEDQHQRMDRWSIGVSLLCLVHCLLTPVLILLFPYMDLDHGVWFSHLFFAVFVVGFGLPALWRGYRHHGLLQPAAIGLSGMLLIFTAFVLPEYQAEHSHSALHTYLTSIGSIALVTAHVMNMRGCKCCKH